MPDPQLGGGSLKKGGNVPLAVGEAVCKLEAVIRLDTLRLDPPAGILLHQAL